MKQATNYRTMFQHTSYYVSIFFRILTKLLTNVQRTGELLLLFRRGLMSPSRGFQPFCILSNAFLLIIYIIYTGKLCFRTEREKVRVSFFQQSKPQEVDLPDESNTCTDTEVMMMATTVALNDANHIVYNRTERQVQCIFRFCLVCNIIVITFSCISLLGVAPFTLNVGR